DDLWKPAQRAQQALRRSSRLPFPATQFRQRSEVDIFTVQVSARMENVKYDEPRVAINRVYTRTGDKGETGLAGGQRVAKDSLRIEAYGTVDELNASIGVARATAEESIQGHAKVAELDTILKRVQHELFNVGSILATLPEDVH